jgi:predicted neutral ceramidase superfamily lipid hydrolase
VDVDRWLMIVRVLAYIVLAPALAAIAIEEYNAERIRRAGILGLVSLYYAIALANVTTQILGLAMQQIFLAMLTPMLILQVFLVIWILIKPRRKNG